MEKKKLKKNISSERENLSKPNYIVEISPKGKYLGCPHCKILGTILKVDGGRTSTNEPENKKIHDLTSQEKKKEEDFKIALMYR